MIRIIDLPKITDNRGSLSFLESERHIPFKINSSFLLTIREKGRSFFFKNAGNTEFCFLALTGNFQCYSRDKNNNDCVIHSGISNTALLVQSCPHFELYNCTVDTVILILASKKNIYLNKNQC